MGVFLMISQSELLVLQIELMNSEPLEKATTGLQAIVDSASTLLASQDGVKILAERPGSVFCPAIKIYSNLLTSYSLSEMEDLDCKLKRNPSLDEVAEAFWDVEERWDEILAKIDVAINKGDDGCGGISNVSDIAPLDAVFIDVKNQEKVVRLENVLCDNQESRVHLVLLRHLS